MGHELRTERVVFDFLRGGSCGDNAARTMGQVIAKFSDHVAVEAMRE